MPDRKNLQAEGRSSIRHRKVMRRHQHHITDIFFIILSSDSGNGESFLGIPLQFIGGYKL